MFVSINKKKGQIKRQCFFKLFSKCRYLFLTCTLEAYLQIVSFN